MSANCAQIENKWFCQSCSQKLVQNGRFWRKSDSKWIRRWRCLGCNKSVSQATGSETFGQNKRRVNEPLRKLLAVGVSQRSAAYLLNIHRTTVARKLVFLGLRARIHIFQRNKRHLFQPLKKIQFDELETFEHTKLKPLSVALAVAAGTRELLDFQVASMPAKGPLAAKSRQKYGRRDDDRKQAMQQLFENICPFVDMHAELLSDKNPKYPGWLREKIETWKHRTVKGRRGSQTGSGELKRGGYDPLFSLNHTCAMLRANINRLFRKTWNTTKRPDRLAHHLAIYAEFHNQRIAEKAQKKARLKAA